MQAPTFIASIPFRRNREKIFAHSDFVGSNRVRTPIKKPVYVLGHLHIRKSLNCCKAEVQESFGKQIEDESDISDPVELSPDELELCENMPQDIPMINKLILVGRLGRDPELKNITEDMQVCRFSLAVPNEYDPDDPDDQDKTSWFTVEAWGLLAQYIANTGYKGVRVGVTGSLDVNAWTGRDGVEREDYIVTADSFEILQSRSERFESMVNEPKASSNDKFMRTKSYEGGAPEVTEELEDLPF